LKRETDIAENSICELQTLPKQIQNEIDTRRRHEESNLLNDLVRTASKQGCSLRGLIDTAQRPVKGGKARAKAGRGQIPPP
jgi:hypothetical protein